MRQIHALISTAALLGLSACGGGGGSDGTDGGNAGTPLTLSASNYVTAAGEAAGTAMSIVDTGTGGAGLITGAQSASSPRWGAVALRQVALAARQFAQYKPLLTGAVTTMPVACSGGGSLELRLDDADGSLTLTKGDVIGVTAHQCVESGETADGGLTITMNSTPGGDITAGSVYSLDASIVFSTFSFVSSGLSATVSGNLNLQSVRVASQVGTDVLSTTNLSTQVSVGGVVRTRSVSQLSATVQYSSAGTSTTVAGTVSSSALEGHSVVLATLSPFLRSPDAAYPYAGSASATGANGGRATLTALDASSVLIALDANGDGTAEASLTQPWSSIP